MKTKDKMTLRAIDWDKIASFLRVGATLQEISFYFNISVPTLQKRCKEELGMSFGDFKNQCFSEGNIDLRKVQHEIAIKGNVQMLIWLGKNRLNQTDKIEKTELGDRKIEISVAGENVNVENFDNNSVDSNDKD